MALAIDTFCVLLLHLICNFSYYFIHKLFVRDVKIYINYNELVRVFHSILQLLIVDSYIISDIYGPFIN